MLTAHSPLAIERNMVAVDVDVVAIGYDYNECYYCSTESKVTL